MGLSSNIATSDPSAMPSNEAETPAIETEAAKEEKPKPSPKKRELKPLDPVRILGQFLVWVGSLLVLFALFQLWGTGLLEGRAQDKLDLEFEALVAEAAAAESDVSEVAEPEVAQPEVAGPAPTEPEAAEPVAVPAEPELPPVVAEAPPGPTLVPVGSDQLPTEGQAVARITIDSIGLNKTVVQGVQRDTLRDGPGHYPTSPLPGQVGNAAIAGHRTTHGAPFFNLDQVQPGDHIDVETLDGTYRYEVQAHTGPDGATRGYFIVDPSDVSVISDQGDNRLTLTACHPRYSARQRIVVNAVLIGEASPAPVVVAEPTATVPQLPTETTTEADLVDDPLVEGETPDVAVDDPAAAETATDQIDSGQIDPGQTIVNNNDLLESSLGWQKQELDPTILWATVMMVVLHAGWVLGRIWRRRYAYVLAFPAAVAPMFICFIHLDRLLPAF